MEVLQKCVDDPFTVSRNLINGSRSQLHHWHGVRSDATLLSSTRKVNFRFKILESANPKP
jgi:hypothetical protein